MSLPALSVTLINYQSGCKKQEMLDVHAQAMKDTDKFLQAQALHQDQQACITQNGEVFELLQRYVGNWKMRAKEMNTLTTVEKKLIADYPLPNDEQLLSVWIRTSLDQIDETMKSLVDQINDLDNRQTEAMEDALEQLQTTHTHLRAFCEHTAGIWSIAKIIAKSKKFTHFHEQLDSLVKLCRLEAQSVIEVMSSTPDSPIVPPVWCASSIEKFEKFNAAVERTLRSLCDPMTAGEMENFETTLQKEDFLSRNDTGGDNKVSADCYAVLSLMRPEMRNEHGMEVRDQLMRKLNGQVDDGQQSVEEQVNFIIEQATNVDNLALVYEGWTAWV